MHDWGDEQYPKTRAAEQRADREPLAPYVWVAVVVAVVCIVIAALVVVLSDRPASGAADRAAHVAPPSAQPGPPIHTTQTARCGEREPIQ